MDIKGIRRENLRRLRKKDENQREQADRLGISPAYLSQIMTGHRDLGEKVAREIEVQIGLPPFWLDQPHGRTDEGLRVLTHPHLDHAGHILRVPLFDATPSMGLGAARPERDTVLGSLPVSQEWVRRNLVISAPKNLAVLTAYGDSMAPTFSDGDMLLVDRGITEIKVDAVYVLALHDELYVKRVQRRITDGAIIIKSDNDLYDPIVLSNGEYKQLCVLGRVLWAWNGRRL